MKLFKTLISVIVASMAFVSCQETDNTFDPYENWQARNADWWEAIVRDSVHAAIDQAKAQWGEQWQEHCQWRMIRTLYKSQDEAGTILDSICVKDLGNDLTGEELQASIEKGSPAHSDSVRISFRGYLMPALNYTGHGSEMAVVQEVFSTSYYGDYNPSTATPVLMGISGLVEGFKTALQYMKDGDHWMIYIPYKLGYNATAQGKIPAYSTLQFDVHFVKWYESGSHIPSVWD